MDKQQAIKIINQLLDQYRWDESNWEPTPKQEIFWESYNDHETYTIEGTAHWQECCTTRTVGDEEIPVEFFEPTLSSLDCHLMTFDINGNPIEDILICDSDL